VKGFFYVVRFVVSTELTLPNISIAFTLTKFPKLQVNRHHKLKAKIFIFHPCRGKTVFKCLYR